MGVLRPFGPVRRIDWTNPLTRGLTEFVIFDGNGPPVDLARGYVLDQGGDASRGVSPEGSVAGFDGVGEYYGAPDFNNYGGFSGLTTITRMNWSGNSGATIVRKDLQFIPFHNASGGRGRSIIWYSSGGYIAGPYTPCPTNQWVNWETRWKKNNGVGIYVNGSFRVASGASGYAIPHSASQKLRFGGNGSGSEMADCQIALYATWDRELTDLESATFRADPYQIIRRRFAVPPIFLVPTPGVSGTAEINQSSGLTAVGSKLAAGLGEVTGAAASIVGGSKRTFGSVSIGQSVVVSGSGVKSARGSALIDQASVVTGSGEGSGEAVGTGQIDQASALVASGVKRARGVCTLSQPSTLSGAGTKRSAGAGVVSQAVAIGASGVKRAAGSCFVGQASVLVASGYAGVPSHFAHKGYVSGGVMSARISVPLIIGASV